MMIISSKLHVFSLSLFLILLLNNVFCQSTIGETISFQLHSYDDMREWRPSFYKGLFHYYMLIIIIVVVICFFISRHAISQN